MHVAGKGKSNYEVIFLLEMAQNATFKGNLYFGL